jgi:hypothetical protein
MKTKQTTKYAILLAILSALSLCAPFTPLGYGEDQPHFTNENPNPQGGFRVAGYEYGFIEAPQSDLASLGKYEIQTWITAGPFGFWMPTRISKTWPWFAAGVILAWLSAAFAGATIRKNPRL